MAVMRRLIPLLALLFAGVAQAQMPGQVPAGSNTLVTSTGGTVASTLAAKFSRSLDVMLDGGAKCDGSTNDTAALQAIITGAAGTANVIIPPGVTCITTSLTAPSYSYIEVLGTLKLATHANATTYGGLLFLTPANAVNVVVTGNYIGTLDGNSSNQLTPGVGGAGYSTAFSNNGGPSTNITLRDITIQNTKNWPFSVDVATKVLVENVIVSAAGNSPQFSNCNECWARHLNITGVSDESFAFYGGDTNSGITDSYLQNGAADGITVLNDSGSSAASSHILIAHNIVTGMADAGASVAQGVGAAGTNSDIVFDTNMLHGNGASSAGPGGIEIGGANRVTAIGNTIDHDLGVSGQQNIGIWVKSSTNTDLLANTIYDEGQTSGAIGTGVHLDSTDTVVRNIGNTIYDDQGSPTMTTGFTGTAVSGNSFIGNSVSPSIATPYPGTYPSDTIWAEPNIVTTAAVASPAALATTSVGAMTFVAGGALSLTGGGSASMLFGNNHGTGLQLLDAGGTIADYLFVTPAQTGGSVIIGSGGSDANPPMTYKAQGSGYHYFYNANGGILQLIGATASAVNRFTINSAASGTDANMSSNTTQPLSFGTAGTGGSGVQTLGAVGDLALTAVASGASATAANNIDRVILGASVTSPFTLTMAAAPIDGQPLLLECGATLVLTVSPNSGQTMIGSPTGCTTTQGHAWHYRASGASWWMDY